MSRENDIWNRYMKKIKTAGNWINWEELEAIIKSIKIKVEFKKRALEILIKGEQADIKWRKILNKELAIYTSNLVKKNLEKLKDKDDHKSVQSLYFYNDLILDLITLLPKKEAESLFKLFQIKDFSVYWNMDNCSGYEPLQFLYEDKKIDESWKMKAAKQMHEIIKKEQQGEMKPRKDYEDAFNWYVQILSFMLYGGKLPVSKEFYQNEIAFLLETSQPRPVIKICNTSKAIKQIKDRKIKHSFVRHQIFNHSGKKFRVYNPEHVKAAKKIIAEFPEDKELIAYLKKELEKGIEIKLVEIKKGPANKKVRQEMMI